MMNHPLPIQQPVQTVETRVDHLLRINPHVDGGWFWSKYSANPYVGCRYGCTYCFLRQRNYGIVAPGHDDTTDSFSHHIQIRINAAEVLDRELAQLPRDVIITGDYQPVDQRYRLSRKLLEVCLHHAFPVMIITKSPAVLQDLDLIQKINRKTWACVVFSIAFSCSSRAQKILEPHTASIESRFAAMKKVADSGVPTGTSLIPVMPLINDDETNLRSIVQQTQHHAGRFVLAGGLVLGDQMEDTFFNSLAQIDTSLPERYRQLYQGGYAPRDDSWRTLGLNVKRFCLEQGLHYRIPRYIPADPAFAHKKKAEELFLQVYEMELTGKPEPEVSQLRQQAWQTDELGCSSALLDSLA